MNTGQLGCVIKCDEIMSKVVIGVYPYDRLPRYINEVPQGVIVNTDAHDGPGDHWVALYIDDSNRGEFFCSFGYSVTQYSKQFINYFNHLGIKAVTSNRQKLQSDNTNVCGYYAVYYLAHRCRGISLTKIVETFDKFDTVVNDAYVQDFIVNTYTCCF